MAGDDAQIIDDRIPRPEWERELQPLCDAGMMAELKFLDGTTTSAVLVGVSSDVLIVDHWDRYRAGGVGQPFTVLLAAVESILVP